MEWNSPESEMVAYRSFSPFFHLILCYEAPQVQLWALWAILHVCSKNGENLCIYIFTTFCLTVQCFSPTNRQTLLFDVV
jgi:Zyg-11 family protein